MILPFLKKRIPATKPLKSAFIDAKRSVIPTNTTNRPLSKQEQASKQTLSSRLGLGWVRHRRYRPKAQSFRYNLHMYCLNLDQLQQDFHRHPLFSDTINWAWFRRRDYFNPDTPSLKQAIQDHVMQLCGKAPKGPILLCTHIRTGGYNFNPVSFYFCFDQEVSRANNHQPCVILAQITNTPWGERHTYCLSCHEDYQGKTVIKGQQKAHVQIYEFAKAFHVSPFIPMEQSYSWRFKWTKEGLLVHMNNDDALGNPVFDATLNLKWSLLNRAGISKVLATQPFMAFKVSLGIYYQALKLWLKGTPFFNHPRLSRYFNQINKP